MDTWINNNKYFYEIVTVGKNDSSMRCLKRHETKFGVIKRTKPQ